VVARKLDGHGLGGGLFRGFAEKGVRAWNLDHPVWSFGTCLPPVLLCRFPAYLKHLSPATLNIGELQVNESPKQEDKLALSQTPKSPQLQASSTAPRFFIYALGEH
jgi:hypothetical protein